jgi:hypothetical protein
VQPRFPFGYGLPYTQFSYSFMEVIGRSINFNLTNIGIRDGSEVAQLYLSFPTTAGGPPKCLKQFQKVFLKLEIQLRCGFSCHRETSQYGIASFMTGKRWKESLSSPLAPHRQICLYERTPTTERMPCSYCISCFPILLVLLFAPKRKGSSRPFTIDQFVGSSYLNRFPLELFSLPSVHQVCNAQFQYDVHETLPFRYY